MKLLIGKKLLLVVLVSAGQLACLLVGVLWLARVLEIRAQEAIQQQILTNNQQSATRMSELIGEMNIPDLTIGSREWERLQKAANSVRRPDEGFLCVVRSDDGKMICHPELPDISGMAEAKSGSAATCHCIDGGQPLADLTANVRPNASGLLTMPGGTRLIAVRDLPELGLKVIAHQGENETIASVDRLAALVRRVGVAAALLVAALTALVTAATVQRYENKLANINADLGRLVERRSRALLKTRDAVIFGLARLAESRDDDTGRHLERIRSYVEILARVFSKTDPQIDDEAVQILGLASSLHDIGKVGVPDAVLCKPGPLTAEERSVIQKHPVIGGDCLKSIEQRLGEDDFLGAAREIAFAHHERWDGGGYPYGLKGEDIPLSARIVAVADVYDALTTKRVYKDAKSHEEAKRVIVEGSGKQFDPQVVHAFLSCETEFCRIAFPNGAANKRVAQIALT